MVDLMKAVFWVQLTLLRVITALEGAGLRGLCKLPIALIARNGEWKRKKPKRVSGKEKTS